MTKEDVSMELLVIISTVKLCVKPTAALALAMIMMLVSGDTLLVSVFPGRGVGVIKTIPVITVTLRMSME